MSYSKPFQQKPSDPISGDRFSDDWIARYEESHKDPVNRVFHTFGIPMIALSIPLLLIAPFMRGFWKIAVGLFLTGWVFQFVGHAFEGRPPEFFKDWRFLFVGLRWWLKSRLSASLSLLSQPLRPRLFR
jgi:uncharacterized membrane protein YGL010W